jgi:hypothetical protein
LIYYQITFEINLDNRERACLYLRIPRGKNRLGKKEINHETP